MSKSKDNTVGAIAEASSNEVIAGTRATDHCCAVVSPLIAYLPRPVEVVAAAGDLGTE